MAADDPACTALAQAERSVHCVNNSYTWSRINTNPDCIGTNPDCTLFTEFLFRLNNRCTKDETIPCTRNDDCDKVGGKCGFAGYRDWRIPNIRELQSIVDYGRCTVNPEFDACQDEAAIHLDFGPNAPHNYWSFTSTVAEPTRAWIVNFDDGDGDSHCKDQPTRPDNGTLL